jgi:hypothetical protein
MRFRAIKIVFMLMVFILAAQSALAATSEEYYNAGMSLYQKAQYGQSIQYYQAAIQLDPSNWRAYQGMGHSYYRAGNIPEAVKAYDASLKLNPGNAELQKFVDNLKASQPAAATTSATPHEKVKPANKTDQKVRFGLILGGQMCKVNESSTDSSESSSSKLTFKPAFGGCLQIKLSPKFSFCPELLYAMKGDKNTSTSVDDLSDITYEHLQQSNTWVIDDDLNLTYVEFPVLFRFYPTQGHNLNLIFGPSISFLMSAKLKSTTHWTYMLNNEVLNDETTTETDDMKKDYSSADLGFILGAGYEVSQFTFDFRTDIGMSNLIKGTDNSGYTAKNFTIGLFVGYMF